jgi:hypothetical protein
VGVVGVCVCVYEWGMGMVDGRKGRKRKWGRDGEGDRATGGNNNKKEREATTAADDDEDNRRRGGGRGEGETEGQGREGEGRKKALEGD